MTINGTAIATCKRSRQAMNAAHPNPADAGVVLERGDDHRTAEARAGSHPNSRLVTRQSPTQIAIMEQIEPQCFVQLNRNRT